MRNGDALSARQAEATERLARDLLASAEIVRQGEMQRHHDPGAAAAGGWRAGYAVLTRAGFLHWFSAPRDGGPPGAWGPAGEPSLGLNLARCAFDPGEAPVFRLVEAGGGGWLGPRARAQALRCADVEGCMDWAADLREAIAGGGGGR